MQPFFQHKDRTIYYGDCLDIMPQLPENSVDAVVTDPPYGWSFMGKKWDYDVPGQEVWSECLRLLKPGGHILVCCGTRTQHRMAVNIEDAGFEIRDLVAWVYGSGFPKSLDIGKAVDKMQGNERQTVGIKRYAGPAGNDRNFGIGNSDGNPTKRIDTKGTSPWEGWGTALKPSMELWTLARKPLERTVAENVLKYGTGGLNIDGCRIAHDEQLKTTERSAPRYSGRTMANGKVGGIQSIVASADPLGRFPANLIHDGSEEVLRLFPESVRMASTPAEIVKNSGFRFMSNTKQGQVNVPEVNGSAARFFYCPKADSEERNIGLKGKRGNTHATVKPIDLMRYLCRLITPPHGIVLDPFMGSGSTLIACKLEWFQFIGIEIDRDYCEIAARRFPQEVLELT